MGQVEWRVTGGTVVVIHVVKQNKESLYSSYPTFFFCFLKPQFHLLRDVEEVGLIVCRVNDLGIPRQQKTSLTKAVAAVLADCSGMDTSFLLHE